MPAHSFADNSIIEDLSAIFRRERGHGERESRIALFNSLADLEKQAFVRGASDCILKRVAESRFLAGLMREAVSPVRYQSARSARQVWTAAPDLHASREPA